jgi:hypothetical protein
MLAILHLLGMFIVDLFKSRRRLEAENLFLRHQLGIALRHAPARLRLRGSDRALLVWMTQCGQDCSIRCRLFNRKPFFGGIVRASRRFGAGSRERRQDVQKSIGACVTLSDG